MSRLPDSLRAALEHTTRVGEPPGGAHARGEARNEACGDVVVVWLQWEGEDGEATTRDAGAADGERSGPPPRRVARAGFKAQGCPATMATLAGLCEVIEGLALEGAWERTLRAEFARRFGESPPAHGHALQLGLQALRAARERA